MSRAKETEQVPPRGMQDSPVSDAHWGFKEGPGQPSYRTATSKTLVLLSPGNIPGSSPKAVPALHPQHSSIQQLQQPEKPKGQSKHPGVTDEKGTEQARLTFL